MSVEGQGAEHQNWETPTYRLARGGLSLAELQQLTPEQCSRMSNLVYSGDEPVLSRLGQTLFATFGAGATVHSIGRLNTPPGGVQRFWGSGTSLFRGASGGPGSIATGFSGDPLTFLTYRPQLSGESWMYVADRSKMVKVSAASVPLSIGLPAPASLTSAIAAIFTTNIARFDSGDNTQAVNWTPTAGQDRSTPPITAGTPTIADVPGAAAVAITTMPGNAKTGYASMMGIALNRNLSVLQGGAVQASDEDFIHGFIQVDRPDLLEEVRVYLVCSDGFVANVQPGRSGSSNTDAFVKTFRPHDFTGFVEQQASAQSAAEVSRRQELITEFHEDRQIELDALGNPISQPTTDFRPALDPTRRISDELVAGRNVLTEYGIIGVPLRRGDFLRIGNTTGRDWNTITGLIIVVQTSTSQSVTISFDDWSLTGGAGPDTSEPGAQKYDFRATNYDTRTGDEGNPTAVQANSLHLDSLRRPINLQTPPAGDSSLRQRFYRRGGSLPTDWFFLGTNTSDGGIFTDNLSDLDITAAGTLQLDNDQPVTTVNSAGATILAQPLPILFGPIDDMIFGLGDPNRPGHVYHSKPGKPGSWPPNNRVEVCSPSEEVMSGCVYGAQGYVFSRDRLYSLHTNVRASGAVIALPTACTPGLITRWGLAVSPQGIFYIARDGIRVTQGGASEFVSPAISPLFDGRTVNGFLPVDLTATTSMRLRFYRDDLWFIYRDTGATMRCLIYSLLYRYWRPYNFGRAIAEVFGETTIDGTSRVLFGGSATGAAYEHSGFTDDGIGIACSLRTGAWDFGHPRQEKLLGDLIFDADFGAALTVTVQTFLNDELIANPAMSASATAGEKRFTFDPFGQGSDGPQRARTVSTNLSWTAATTARSILHRLGISHTVQPDVTLRRVTTWDDLGTPTEKFITGILLDCDTGNQAITFVVEYDLNGAIFTAATMTVQHSGRHKQGFSWPVIKGNFIRLRPSGSCQPLVLYRHDWLFQPEPPRVAKWDTNWEIGHDVYYTGLDLDVDTFGANKTIEVYADGALIAGSPFTVNANGRRLKHLTFGPARAHHLRYLATDANRGLLYGHKWWVDDEPSEQTNWNQNFTVEGTLADKFIKGIILECDTFGANKTVEVQIDGAVVQTLTVNANGRSVLQFSFAQALGRVLRLLPTDSNPGRVYSKQWIFDEEPLKLLRWESQELTLGGGWTTVYYGNIVLKSTADVTLTITHTVSQTGTLVTKAYTIPSTAGVKRKPFVPLDAVKGVLSKWVFTSAAAFHLYREETEVFVQPFDGGEPRWVRPFGNDDLDLVRQMVSAPLAAARGGA